ATLAAATAQRRPGRAALLVVDGDGLTEGRHAPVRDLLGSGAVSGIVVADSVERLPSVCTTVIELDGPDGSAQCVEPASGTVVEEVLVAGVPEPDARRCARALAGLEDPEMGDEGARLPPVVPLVGLLGLPRLAGADVLARWRAAALAARAAPTLAVPVGVSEDGPLVFDLVHDGPHALVAGTTGSGKSELLRSLVAGLAATYGPDQLTFVLVDFKGGSAFGPLAGLPHVVGLVTDLDEHLGERALRCLEAELKHRELCLRQAGVSDLRGYVAGGQSARPPLPRLVVIIDEFATMAAELPGFIDSLVGIAQRGRSLGVHLVLATQRPSGAVSDNIRANTNLRVALRVQDAPDSSDLIGTPQAAALDRRHAGRGYVRLGHGEVVAFQAALVTTATPAVGAPVQVRPFAFDPRASATVNAGGLGAGRADRLPPGPAAPRDGAATAPAPEAPTDLTRLVDAARVAADAAGLVPARCPWPEPLAPHVDLDRLPAGALALADEPDRQRQTPFAWSPATGNLLLYGVAGSGTTTALSSLALTLARATGPDALHLYVLDAGTGALAPLAALPHVGAVVAAGERERQQRLLRTLRAELERRRAATAAGQGAAAHWPSVVLLIDNLGGFCTSLDDVAGLALRDELLRLVADGPALGMVVAASADRPGAVPVALSSLVPDKLLFRLADPYDYASFGIAVADVPRMGPGRAIDAVSRREVQVGMPAARGGLGEAVATLAGEWGSSTTGPRPSPIAVLPNHVTLHDVVPAAGVTGPEWFVPLGLDDGSLAPAGLRLGEGDHALVAGPARCGRSTALCTVAAVVSHHRPDVAITVVALRRSPLRDAPGATEVLTEPHALSEALARAGESEAPQLVLVDDAEGVDDAGGAMAALLARRRPDVHVVAAGRADALRAMYGHWSGEVRRSRQGLALRPQVDFDGELWQTLLPRHGPSQFCVGRGYLVLEGQVELLQVARP
ncbi:MAG: FtsK/SpoIIIE domain-containing protein, partial [Actinomycetota bacterium]|nr:FtsK/SpoIIIE domain-containing protein [Actinomycetota bacterium]